MVYGISRILVLRRASSLSQNYNQSLPSQHFTYLRVKYAFLTQFGHNEITFKELPIPPLLLSPPSRRVISTLYTLLLQQDARSLMDGHRTAGSMMGAHLVMRTGISK